MVLAMAFLAIVVGSYMLRYFIVPWSIQQDLFGRSITSLAERPTYLRMGGLEALEESWFYELTDELCGRLARHYGCYRSGGSFGGFRCREWIWPNRCLLVRKEYGTGRTSSAAIEGNELVITTSPDWLF